MISWLTANFESPRAEDFFECCAAAILLKCRKVDRLSVLVEEAAARRQIAMRIQRLPQILLRQ
jgi:hypothetical protein